MLTETKITIAVAAGGGNSALGVSINEFLRLYLFKNEEFDEVITLDNEDFRSVIPVRKKIKAVTYNESSKSSFDPRKSSSVPSEKISDSTYDSHTSFQMKHIRQHRDKLVNWKKEEAWWRSIYKQRFYIMKNQDIFTEKINFVEGFSSSVIWSLNSEIHMNQFCYLIYGSYSKYDKYKELFWLICSIDGKNPEETNDDKKISSSEKATFPTEDDSSNEKTITYMTLSQAKKKASDIANIKVSEKDKYVVYDWSEAWWNWSYKYRFQKDKADENSAFPLSNEFKKAKKGWDSALEQESLNSICKNFYEKENSSSDEKEDALRYCSAEGK
ncbi:hypothetical protein [Candidatus Mycoplasma haematohominis]|uniref:hypothetical protein n=1 Tax=Candidatus Mycoplasma haematohominis TaxID=1494318 RepID=UPI001C0A6815|nr:hypothetical protein [Candidatus Mycoplasma haemohominis]